MPNPGVVLERVGSTAERLRQLPYEKRVCKTEAYPAVSRPDKEYTGLSVAEFAEWAADVGLEATVLNGEIDRGTPRYRSKILPYRDDVDEDRLPGYIKALHEKGIIVISYYPLIFCKPLVPLHPEWLMHFLFDDRPFIENQGWFCLNSPFRDWVSDYLIEWLDNLDLDGFYFDDTNIGSHQGGREYPGCCCEVCTRLLRDETGLKMPREVDFGSLDFRRWIRWRYEKTKEAVKYILGRIREAHPDCILEFNYYTRPDTSWVRGHPIDMFGFEDIPAYAFTEMSRSSRDTGYVSKINRGKGTFHSLLRHGQQSMPGVASGLTVYPERWIFTQHILGAIANGGSAFSNYTSPYLQDDMIRFGFAEAKKRREYVAGDTVKYAAVHYSTLNRDFRSAELYKNIGKEGGYTLKDIYGLYDMLGRSHILLDFLHDKQLGDDTLFEYPVLLLSNSACLSDAQVDNIRRYVEQGGTLIATHQTSTMDELGQRLGNFALAEVLGLDHTGPHQTIPGDGVVYVPQGKLAAETGYQLLPFYGIESTVEIRPDADIEVLCTRSSLQGDTLPEFNPKMEYDTGEPTVTVNRFGKGKAYYLSGDIGRAYVEVPYPPLMRLLASLVGRTPSPIQVDAPQAIEVTAAIRPSGELMIHLLNNPSPPYPPQIDGDDIYRYFFTQEIVPVHDVRIVLSGFKAKAVRLPLQDLTLEIEGAPQVIVVPRVELHEVVLVDLET